MIKIQIKDIEKSIILNEIPMFLVIENFDFFHKIINNFLENTSDISFIDLNYNSLRLQKNILVISNYFDIDIQSSKIIIDYIKNKHILTDEIISNDLARLYNDCVSFIKKLQYEIPYDIEYATGINLDYLIKSLNVVPIIGNNRIETIINYCKINSEVYEKKIMVFVNINAYYSSNEISIITSELYNLGIYSIFISSNDINIKQLSNKNIIYVDNDLCEFYSD